MSFTQLRQWNTESAQVRWWRGRAEGWRHPHCDPLVFVSELRYLCSFLRRRASILYSHHLPDSRERGNTLLMYQLIFDHSACLTEVGRVKCTLVFRNWAETLDVFYFVTQQLMIWAHYPPGLAPGKVAGVESQDSSTVRARTSALLSWL